MSGAKSTLTHHNQCTCRYSTSHTSLFSHLASSPKTDRAAGEEGLKGIQGSKALCCVVDNIMDVSTLLSDIYNMY